MPSALLARELLKYSKHKANVNTYQLLPCCPDNYNPSKNVLMPYTDIWRCKKCNVLPDIQMIGRHFLIECECGKKSSVEADSLDEVVSQWNEFNDPLKKKKGLGEWFQEWSGTLKNYMEYQRDCYRQRRERKERLKRTVLEIQNGEESDAESELELPGDRVES
jgi:hypothetical protein